jgi:hypothetical protein
MKKVSALVTVTVLVLAGSALAADWQTGKIVYHGPKAHSMLAGQKDLYYVGTTVCTRGTDNSAPTCFAPGEDVVVDQEAYTDITLADGASFRIEKNSPSFSYGMNSPPNSIFTNVKTSWYVYVSEVATEPAMKTTCDKGICTSGKISEMPTEGTFQYRLGKLRKGNVQEIEVELAPSFAPTNPACLTAGMASLCKPTKEKGEIQR